MTIFIVAPNRATRSTTSSNAMFVPFSPSSPDELCRQFLEAITTPKSANLTWNISGMLTVEHDRSLDRMPKGQSLEVLSAVLCHHGLRITAQQKDLPSDQTFITPIFEFDSGLWLLGRSDADGSWMLVRTTAVHDLFPHDPNGDVYTFTAQTPQ